LAWPGAAARLVLSRGVHILLPLEPGATSEAMLIPKTEDGRVIFAIPWQGRLLVGTTDRETTFDEELIVQQDEAAYLLNHLNRYVVRSRQITEVVSAFAGIRPLVRARHARVTKRLIRDHEVEIDEHSGLVSILGGKWTTYRAMAEDTIDAVQRCLGQTVHSGRTKHHQLSGAEGFEPDYWNELAGKFNLPEVTARHLASKFGTKAADVVSLTRGDRELRLPIVEDEGYIRAEIVYTIRQEMAATIEDVLARRLGLQYFSWELAGRAAPVVAAYLARDLGWSDSQTADAVHLYVRKIQRMRAAMGLLPATPAERARPQTSEKQTQESR